MFFEETQLSSTVRVFLAIVMLVGTGAQAKGKGVSHSVSKTTAPRKGGGKGGSHAVRGTVTKKGTYVRPHHQTNPNKTQHDNWSTKGNVNPDTGQSGTKNPTR